MTKEELIKVIKSSSTVETLYKNEAYIIEVEVGDMPKEYLKGFLETIGNKLNDLGLHDFVLAPTSNGQGHFKFYRLKDRTLIDIA